MEKKEAVVKLAKKEIGKGTQAGLTLQTYGLNGKVIGKVQLPKEIFGAKVNNALMSQAVRVYLANQRSGSASTKTRGEVRGSTRKIYRQKGTGRARHGAIRAPIFVGGGIAFGPKPRDFSLKMPDKMRRRALFSALSLKLNNKEIILLESLADLKPKTKEFVKVVKNLSLLDKKGKADKVLFVTGQKRTDWERGIKNVQGLSLKRANVLNTYEVLDSKHVLFLKDAIEELEATFLKS